MRVDLQKLADKLGDTSTADLIDTFNGVAQIVNLANLEDVAPIIPVKKFSDRKTAVRRVFELLKKGIDNDLNLSAYDLPMVTPETVMPAPTTARVDKPTRVNLDPSQIKTPESRASRSAKKEPKEKKVSKFSLLRAAFEASGPEGITTDALAAASGFDAKNARVGMDILKNPKRTKDPLSFVYVKGMKSYFHPQFVSKDLGGTAEPKTAPEKAEVTNE